MDLIQQYRAYYTLYPMEFPILHLFGHRPVANILFWVWSNIQLLQAVPSNVSQIYVKSKGLSQMWWESEM